MEVQPVRTQVPGNGFPVGGIADALSRLTQPGFVAEDPFGAYLLTLSDPAAQILAALARANTAPAANATRSGAAASALLATASGSGSGAGALLATAASSVLGPAPAAGALQPGAGVINLVQAALGSATRSDPLATPNETGQAVATPPDAAPAADAAPPGTTLASRLPSEAIAAAKTATFAAIAATDALQATRAVDALAQGSANLATDATAKFMGAGTLGQADRALSAYQVIQDAIPAVNRAQAAAAMDAYTSSNPQNPAFSQNAGLPAPRFPVAGGPVALGIDFLS